MTPDQTIRLMLGIWEGLMIGVGLAFIVFGLAWFFIVCRK